MLPTAKRRAVYKILADRFGMSEEDAIKTAANWHNQTTDLADIIQTVIHWTEAQAIRFQKIPPVPGKYVLYAKSASSPIPYPIGIQGIEADDLIDMKESPRILYYGPLPEPKPE